MEPLHYNLYALFYLGLFALLGGIIMEIQIMRGKEENYSTRTRRNWFCGLAILVAVGFFFNMYDGLLVIAGALR